MSTSSKTKTPAPKSTLRKKTTAKLPQTKKRAVSAPKKPTAAATTVSAELRKRELIEAVVQRSGVKKKDAKPVVEAMLQEIGENLAEGRDLVLPPLGKIKVAREKKTQNGRVIVVRVRQNNRLALAKTPTKAVQ